MGGEQAVKWPPELPGWAKVMFAWASIGCAWNPAVWAAELSSVGRLRITRVLHRRGRLRWTTWRVSLHGFKRYHIPWYALGVNAMSARDLHHLLTGYGIRVWVWSVNKDGVWSVKVKQDQAQWAEYLMLRAGVWPETQLEPETQRQWPALLARMTEERRTMPRRWTHERVWSGSLNEVILEFGLLFPPLAYAAFAGLLELPVALARSVEWRTETVEHGRRQAGHEHMVSAARRGVRLGAGRRHRG